MGGLGVGGYNRRMAKSNPRKARKAVFPNPPENSPANPPENSPRITVNVPDASSGRYEAIRTLAQAMNSLAQAISAPATEVEVHDCVFHGSAGPGNTLMAINSGRSDRPAMRIGG